MSRVVLTLRKCVLCLLHKELRGPQDLCVQFVAPRELNLGLQPLSLFIIPSALIASFFLPPIVKEVTVHEINFWRSIFFSLWTSLVHYRCFNPLRNCVIETRMLKS